MSVTDVRLFFEARNLSVEVVRADEESEQGHYCVYFLSGIESSMFLLLDAFFGRF